MPRKNLLFPLLLLAAAACVFLALSLLPQRTPPAAPPSLPPASTVTPAKRTPAAPSPSPAPSAVPSRLRITEARKAALAALGELPLPLARGTASMLAALRSSLSAPSVGRREAARLSLLAALEFVEYQASLGYPVEDDLAELQGELQAYLNGSDPFEKKRGTFLRGYLSPVDGTLQEYSVSVPEGYDPEVPIPLIVSLHHHGWTDWFRPFQGHPAPYHEKAIVPSPHARGSADYMWVALEEVLASIEDVKRLYNVDGDRVYLTGYSMGGTGSWYVAARYPHLFAAIAPVAGNTDFTAWVKRWDWRLRRDSPFAFLRKFLRESTCPAAYAENLRNVAVLCFHGSRDSIVPVEHARSMVDRLKELGYGKVVYVESDVGHVYRPLGELADWLLRHKRERFPRRVSLKTDLLRHGRAYYARIDGRAEPDRYSRLELEWGDPVTVTTSNVTAFSVLYDSEAAKALPLPEKGFLVDGEAVRAVPKAGLISFVKAAGAWRNGSPPPGVRKRAGLEGPIEDAFRRPFLLVYGTGEADPPLAAASREEAERFALNWERRYNKPCPVKADREVTDEDIRRFNLVLYGAPWVNSLMARVADRLPFEVSRTGIRPRREGAPAYGGRDVGVRFVRPNPLEPSRYLVVNAALSAAALEGVDFRFGNWFDWIPYDNRAWYDFCVYDSRTVSPETFLEVGYFGPEWDFDARWCWKGAEKERDATLERVVPPSVLPPARDTVMLDEFRPIFVRTLKGFYNLGRTWSGAPPVLAGERLEHAVGVRPDSHLMWYLGGRFGRFTVRAGIDYGEGEPSEARAAVELVEFVIVGDGRVLARASHVRRENPVVEMEADVRGVRFLSLFVRRMTPEGWLYGPVIWGNPKLTRTTHEQE